MASLSGSDASIVVKVVAFSLTLKGLEPSLVITGASFTLVTFTVTDWVEEIPPPAAVIVSE